MGNRSSTTSLAKLLIVGLVFRCVLVAISTGDAVMVKMAAFAARLDGGGFLEAIAAPGIFAGGLLLQLWFGLSRSIAIVVDIPVTSVWKLLAVAADVVLVVVTVRWSRERGASATEAWWRGTLVCLSPAAIVAAGHLGTPLGALACALLGAALALERRHAVVCGALLSCALAVDVAAIVPTVAIIVLVFDDRLALKRLLAALIPGCGAAIVQLVVGSATAPSLIQGGGAGVWLSLKAVPWFASMPVPERTAAIFVVAMAVAAGCGVLARRRQLGQLETVTIATIVMVVLIPGFDVSVVIVPVAMLAITRWRHAVFITAAGSLCVCLYVLLGSNANTPLITRTATLALPVMLANAIAVVGLVHAAFSLFGGASQTPQRRATSRRAWRHRQAILPVAFVIVGGVFGASFALVTPPFQVADEPLHAVIGCAVGHGQLGPGFDAPGPFPFTYQTPAGLKAFNQSIIRLKLPKRPETRVDMAALRLARAIPFSPEFVRLDVNRETGEAGVYPPIMYGPQALGCRVGMALSDTPWGLLNRMRLANLAAYLVLGALALGFLRRGREALVIVLLSPMALSSAASASADGQLIACTALSLALYSRWSMSGPPLRAPALIFFVVTAFALSLAKSVYVPLALAPLFLPASRFLSLQWRVVFVVAVLTAAAIGAVVWIPVSRAGLDAWAAERHVVPHDALLLRLKEPFTFAATVLKTIFRERILTGIVGTLGFRDTVLPTSAIYTFWLSLTGAIVVGGYSPRTRPWRGAMLVLLGAGAAYGLHLFYAGYGGVGNGVHVPLVQGRHLLPCLIAVVIGAVQCLRLPVSKRWRAPATAVALLASTTVLWSSLKALDARYYASTADAVEAVGLSLSRPLPPKPATAKPTSPRRLLPAVTNPQDQTPAE